MSNCDVCPTIYAWSKTRTPWISILKHLLDRKLLIELKKRACKITSVLWSETHKICITSVCTFWNAVFVNINTNRTIGGDYLFSDLLGEPSLNRTMNNIKSFLLKWFAAPMASLFKKILLKSNLHNICLMVISLRISLTIFCNYFITHLSRVSSTNCFLIFPVILRF